MHLSIIRAFNAYALNSIQVLLKIYACLQCTTNTWTVFYTFLLRMEKKLPEIAHVNKLVPLHWDTVSKILVLI